MIHIDCISMSQTLKDVEDIRYTVRKELRKTYYNVMNRDNVHHSDKYLMEAITDRVCSMVLAKQKHTVKNSWMFRALVVAWLCFITYCLFGFDY